jgi:hypothetical protein
MRIELENNTLSINGGSAGSIEDALSNYPEYSNELWALLITKTKAYEALEIQLTCKEEELLLVKEHLASCEVSLEEVHNPILNNRVISSTEFRNKLEPALDLIAEKALTDANLMKFFIKLATTPTVDLDSPEVRAGLEYLLLLGVPIDPTQF